MDRSELNEKFCEKEGVDEFEAKYDIPYTKMNCEIFTVYLSMAAGKSYFN